MHLSLPYHCIFPFHTPHPFTPTTYPFPMPLIYSPKPPIPFPYPPYLYPPLIRFSYHVSLVHITYPFPLPLISFPFHLFSYLELTHAFNTSIHPFQLPLLSFPTTIHSLPLQPTLFPHRPSHPFPYQRSGSYDSQIFCLHKLLLCIARRAPDRGK